MKKHILYFLMLIPLISFADNNVKSKNQLINIETIYVSEESYVEIHSYLDEDSNPFYVVAAFLVKEAIAWAAEEVCEYYYGEDSACSFLTQTISIASSVRRKIIKNGTKRIIKFPIKGKKLPTYKNGTSKMKYDSNKDRLEYKYITTSQIIAEEVAKSMVEKKVVDLVKSYGSKSSYSYENKRNNEIVENLTKKNNFSSSNTYEKNTESTQKLQEVIIVANKYKVIKGQRVRVSKSRCKKLIKGQCYD